MVATSTIEPRLPSIGMAFISTPPAPSCGWIWGGARSTSCPVGSSGSSSRGAPKRRGHGPPSRSMGGDARRVAAARPPPRWLLCTSRDPVSTTCWIRSFPRLVTGSQKARISSGSGAASRKGQVTCQLRRWARAKGRSARERDWWPMAKVDLDRISSRLDGQIQGLRGRWQGAGGTAFFTLHQAWTDKQRIIVQALDAFERAPDRHRTRQPGDRRGSVGRLRADHPSARLIGGATT